MWLMTKNNKNDNNMILHHVVYSMSYRLFDTKFWRILVLYKKYVQHNTIQYSTLSYIYVYVLFCSCELTSQIIDDHKEEKNPSHTKSYHNEAGSSIVWNICAFLNQISSIDCKIGYMKLWTFFKIINRFAIKICEKFPPH